MRLWGVDSGQCKVMYVPDKAHANTVSCCALVSTTDPTTGEAMETLYTAGFDGRGIMGPAVGDGRSPYLKLGGRRTKEFSRASRGRQGVRHHRRERGDHQALEGFGEFFGELVGHDAR